MRHTNNTHDIIFASRHDAEEALGHLIEIANEYRMALMADLYDLAGLKCSYSDTNYGWDASSVQKAQILRVRDGYIIDLPDAVHYETGKILIANKRPATTPPTPNHADPKSVFITVNRDVHESVDDILTCLFKHINNTPNREFYITIE